MTPNKTFGIDSASDLLAKLNYDIQRLKVADYSTAVRYAAFDCAIVSLHLVDWVLHSVSETRCVDLCGQSADEYGYVKAFIKRNADRLPHLATCKLIANSSKHMVLRLGDDPSVEALSAIRFDPPFHAGARPESWRDLKSFAVAMVSTGSGTIDAPDFFGEVAAHWQDFLATENLLIDTES